jgi:hypothetical protein
MLAKWLNLAGITLSGLGSLVLAWEVFSLKTEYDRDSWAYDIQKATHDEKYEWLIKAAMLIILFGTILQIISVFIDTLNPT